MRIIVLATTLLLFCQACEETLTKVEAFEQYEEQKEAGDPNAFDLLVRLAKAGNSTALDEILNFTDEPYFPIKEFGETKEKAVIRILEEAPETLRNHHRLGKILMDPEDPALKDLERARLSLKYAAENWYHLSWDEYALMCKNGIGGEVDLESAYFFICALTWVVEPGAFTGGGDYWGMRVELEQELPPDKASHIRSEVEESMLDYGRPDIYSHLRHSERRKKQRQIRRKQNEYVDR